MKKLLNLTIVLLLIICIAISGKAYAASLDCNLEIQTPKAEYSKGDEFTASVYVSGIKSDKGVLALSATLDYDKNSLTLVSMNGKNSWETPTKDVSFNESTGKMALLRSNLGKDDEVIFEMTFQVKEDSNANTSISLKEVTMANGVDTQKSFSTITKDLTVKATTSNPPANDPGTDTNTNNPSTDTNTANTSTPGTNTVKPTTPANNTNTTNTNTNNTNVNNTNTNTTNTAKNTSTNTTDMTTKTGSIPKTGITSNPVLMVSLTTVTALGLYFYAKINFIDKKTRK